MAFKDILETLPAAEGSQLVLLDASGSLAAIIVNGPGTAGSFRVYAYLARRWGEINHDAAEEGLRLYAEHSDEARQQPGKHPNIDRLFEVLNSRRVLRVVIE